MIRELALIIVVAKAVRVLQTNERADSGQATSSFGYLYYCCNSSSRSTATISDQSSIKRSLRTGFVAAAASAGLNALVWLNLYRDLAGWPTARDELRRARSAD